MLMSHPNTLAARTRRSLMALAVAAVLLVIGAFSAHAQAPKPVQALAERATGPMK
jgi:hypothetical protein